MSADNIPLSRNASDKMTVKAERHFTCAFFREGIRDVACVHDAECTQDFLRYEGDGEAEYRGGFNESARTSGSAEARQKLQEAMPKFQARKDSKDNSFSVLMKKWKSE